jgi:hypothetical protein
MLTRFPRLKHDLMFKLNSWFSYITVLAIQIGDLGGAILWDSGLILAKPPSLLHHISRNHVSIIHPVCQTCYSRYLDTNISLVPSMLNMIQECTYSGGNVQVNHHSIAPFVYINRATASLFYWVKMARS